MAIDIRHLIHALYREFDDITVEEACHHILSLGWLNQSIEIDKELWSIEDLCNDDWTKRGALARELIPVKWTGGPPNNDKVFTGSFLTVLIDFILLSRALKKCQTTFSG